uniref:Uncharacterized protein n=1 Tax=Opuntia streptacantha TaxID=393608 RepID=A0A7C8ZX18_OPUST
MIPREDFLPRSQDSHWIKLSLHLNKSAPSVPKVLLPFFLILIMRKVQLEVITFLCTMSNYFLVLRHQFCHRRPLRRSEPEQCHDVEDLPLWNYYRSSTVPPASKERVDEHRTANAVLEDVFEDRPIKISDIAL